MRFPSSRQYWLIAAATLSFACTTRDMEVPAELPAAEQARRVSADSAVAAADTPTAEPQAIGRDSAGVRIVETGAPQAEWRLSAEPLLQIGVVDGDDAYQFSSIAYAGRLSDGRIVVADHQSLQIRFFDRAGVHTATLGGRGAGPGEFRVFARVVLSNDTLVILDGLNRRLVLVSPAEVIAQEISVRDHPVLRAGIGNALLGFAADGRVVATHTPRTAVPPILNSLVFGRDTVAIVLASPDGTSLDTLALVPGGEYVFSGGSAASVMPSGAVRGRTLWARSGVSFGYYPYFGMHGNEVIFATGERPGFEVFSLPAAGERPTRRAVHVTRYTGAERRLVSSIARRYLDWVADEGRASGADNVTEQVADSRARLESLPRGHLVPYIDGMLVDAVGRVWQRQRELPWQDDGRPRTWIVYGTDGQALARIMVPPSFRPIHVEQDMVTGVTRGDADVPFVTIHRIER